MNTSNIDKAYNDTFPGLTMFYRDAHLSNDLLNQYHSGQIIMERGYTDISCKAAGLTTNVRYAIASNSAVDVGEMNPDVIKWGFHVIQSGAFYKVLDIYRIQKQCQILLLHFKEEYLDIFKNAQSNIEDKVITMGRQSFDTKYRLEPLEALQEKEWIKRTSFPIGMSDSGELFY